MSEINPQATPVPTENAQGINIDNILGGGGVPVPTDALPPDNSTAPEQPAGVPPISSPDLATPVDNTPKEDVDEFDKLLLSAEGLSPEDTALRTNILNTFGASNIDAQGNLLDANNRVVLTKANLDKYVLDGELILDANGNHINELGEVITPAEQVAATNTLVNAAKSEIEQEYGFQFLDADGNPKTYSNTAQGNAELLKDAITNTSVNAVSNFLEARPELKQIFYHLENGGTIDNFVDESFDYTNVNVSALSREQRLNFIRTSFEKQGITNSSSMMKLLEAASDEVLAENTSDALLALNKINESARTQAEEQYQANIAKEQDAINSYWADIKGRIDGGKIKDINIPATEKDKFYEYLSVVKDNQGRSQEQIDMANEDPEFNLQVSYLRFKKLDLNALVNIRARGNKLHSARERFNIHQPQAVTSSPPVSTNGRTVISLNDL